MRTPLAYLIISAALSSTVFLASPSAAQSFLNCSAAQTQQLQQTQQIEREAAVVLEAIFRRLDSRASIERPWITLVQNARPQAYSLSSGEIVLTSGLLSRTTSAAELAFVIGHEIAHKLLEHPISQAALLGSQIEKNGLDGELEADSGAIKLLQDIKLTNSGALSLLERLRTELASDNPNLDKALSTRISALSKNAN